MAQELAPLCETNGHRFDGKICIFCGRTATHYGLGCYSCGIVLETKREAYDHFGVCQVKTSDIEEFSLFRVVPMITERCPSDRRRRSRPGP